jgi:quercetin dioxygenase-like cupin family protein
MAIQFWHSSGAEEPIRVPALDLEVRVLLPPEASDGEMTIIETNNLPGFGPPLHRHPETEIFRVLEGRYLIEIDGHRFIAESEDVVSIPGGSAHAFRNLSESTGRQLTMFLPARDAIGFYTELAEVMKGGTPDQDALDQFSKRWKVDFLGPPLSEM